METIKKKYVVDTDQNKVAVLIDIADFEKIEQVLEDYGLVKLMEENDPEQDLDIDDARKFYNQLDKAP
jgi:hypothetical protein